MLAASSGGTKGVRQAVVVSRPVARAAVRGVVYDSLAKRTLAGATVQLMDADSVGRYGESTISDSAGRFDFGNVPSGRYNIGFFHPKLDSMGITAPLRTLEVSTDPIVTANLAIPSGARIRRALCAGRAPSNGTASGAVMGVVRDAVRKEPVAGAKVTAEWYEVRVGRGTMSRGVARRVATSTDGGWYVLCDVPRPGSMLLTATEGSESTDPVEATADDEGLVRRDLYIGEARTIAASDSAHRATRTGTGRVSGVVRAAGGRPLAGAQVSIADGPSTRANERGEFTLGDAPLGTRTIEVRALGYYPEHRIVDVVEGAPPVAVSLATLKSVLDTVKTVASAARYNAFREFLARSHSGMGRYLTAEDIVKRGSYTTSEIFQSVSGLAIEADGEEQFIYMRGVTGPCVPTYYLNGAQLFNLSTRELDAFVRVKDIVGIEVYAGPAAPAQFQPGLSGCGSIVIWTKL